MCTELVRHGVARDTQSAFARTEPVVALALRRAAIGDAAIVGLAGELLVLDALLNVVTPGAVPDVLDAWKGSAPSSRDFQLGDVGVEVKTTTASDSVHHVTGVHQVEPGTSVDGTPESALYLLSLGIRWLGRGATGGFTLPGLVDSVVARAHGAGVTEAVVDQLLTRVRQYGGDAGLGYDHASDSQLPRFLQPFEVRFERLYDMGDDDIHVLDSASLAGATHVDASTVEFTVRLPRRVRGDVNPVSGLRQIARAITARAHLPTKQA
ncbi:PD-(D/E)XK motif protein [Cellulomonas sp. NPDC057328]|uniref:PD-(D/E)XK motif protein n=1 Tax=Cellulomonas sp. NPDC057328 TaxID=3346101 RepID=UPI00362E514B